MKFITKDINKPKSNISDEKIGEVRTLALFSTIILLLFFSDLAYGGFVLEVFLTADAMSFFAYPIIAVIILGLIFLTCFSSILRFVFMELGINFTFISSDAFSALLVLFLAINVVLDIALGKEVNSFFFILVGSLVVAAVIRIFKSMKLNK